MEINEMTQDACRSVLTRVSMGRLGCSLENQPYVVPICFAYEPDYIYVFSTFGQKIKWMRVNPKVCIQIDELTNPSQWVSVIANGTYQELPEPQYEVERAHARKLLEKRSRWWLNALAARRARSLDDFISPLFFRIHVDSVTGLCGRSEGEEAGARPRHK
jgi:uncharacterized protein